MKKKGILPKLAAALFLAEMVLILLSWVLSVIKPEWELRSLLGGEGMRWLVGRHAEVLSTPLLIYILLLSVAWGIARDCGLFKALLHKTLLSYRERIALKYAVITIVAVVLLLLLLSVAPHAMLLGVTGTLSPSPFSAGFVSMTALGICIVAYVYGFLAGRYDSLQMVYDAAISGISSASQLLLFYVLGAHLYFSVEYVFIR